MHLLHEVGLTCRWACVLLNVALRPRSHDSLLSGYRLEANATAAFHRGGTYAIVGRTHQTSTWQAG